MHGSRERGSVPDPIALAVEQNAVEFLFALGRAGGGEERDDPEIGLGDSVPWRHFVGWLDGRAVASASLFLAAGVAGLYFVCTAPDFRGRGIGAAISRAALEGARDLGFRRGVLGSSSMGHGVYRRLGFRDVCSVDVWEWPPEPAGS